LKAADDFHANLQAPIKTFLSFLTAHPGGEEIQYRTPLENLFNAIKLPGRNFTIIQEDRHSGFEVAELVFYPVASREDVEKIPIAFVSHRKALEVYVAGKSGC
jgi:hypothetical protein